MGKHERASVEAAEKIIIKLLVGKPLSSIDKLNVWLRHAESIAFKIREDFQDLISVQHLGNTYESIGDIKVVTKRGEFYIESKMSDTSAGLGTLANVSQNALTENQLFAGEPKSWSLFREQYQHDQWVFKLLGKFKKYPNSVTAIKNNRLRLEAMARHLRKLKEGENSLASNILNAIAKQDREEKLKYLSYLAKQGQNYDRIRKFAICIIMGIHKKNQLKKFMQDESFIKNAKKFVVYYANKSDNDIFVRREDIGKKIEVIVGRYNQFYLEFPSGQTHCKLVANDGKTISLLQLVLHWKNIAQGIKTPCINIFDLYK